MVMVDVVPYCDDRSSTMFVATVVNRVIVMGDGSSSSTGSRNQWEGTVAS